MVIGRKVTRRTNRTTSSARKSATRKARDSSPEPDSPLTFTISPNSVHSPYYLTSGDNPGHSIISEVLDGSNYDNWRIAMNIALDAKNKLAFIDGSIVRPSESEQIFRIWSRCNSMVKSWILNSVSKEIYKSILRFSDASEIWKDLSTHFHITSLPRSYQLSQQIWSLNQGSMDLSTYYTKLKTLWNELDGTSCEKTCHTCDCCKSMAKKSDHAKVIKFLAGLNDSYVVNATAFQVTVPDPTSASTNAASYQSQKPARICSHCGYTGHTVDMCYKIHGYPPNFKQKNSKTSSEKQPYIPKPPQSSCPVVAQVAVPSDHNNAKERLTQLSKDQIHGVIDYFNVQLQPSINQLSEEKFTSGGLITTFPGMAFSSSTLHFVGALRATGNVLSFDSWIIDSGATHHDPIKGLMIGQGEEIANLYVVDVAFGLKTSFQHSSFIYNVVDSELWHNRLGHPSDFKTDLGPFSVPTVEGYKHFLTIVDDHTRVTWVYLLRTKDEVRVIPDFLKMIENQYNCKVRGVRSAVFLINRLPTPLLQNKTLFALLTGKMPDYKGLRVFGCLNFCSTSSKGINKFQPRACPCVFLGYPAGYKRYKLLDMETNKVHISRHVVFHETNILFTSDQNEPLPDVFSHMPDSSTSPSSSATAGNIPAVIPVVQNVPTAVASSTEESIHRVERDKEKRSSKPPAYLDEYYCNMEKAEIPYPFVNYVFYAELSKDYKAYICSVNLHAEPTSFSQAKKFAEWLTAMNEELFALEKTGSLERNKARLIAKGYTQREGVDFVDTYSPVAKMTTVKTLLTVAAAKGWSLTQLDISNAFLNGDLDEEIYMTLPPGYTTKNGESLPPNAVCRLKKSLYGLKQTSRHWFIKFSSVLLGLRFKKSHADHTPFVKNEGGVYLAVLVYVDDIIIPSNSDPAVDQLKANLEAAFRLRDLGPLRYFLGLEIARSAKGISVCQRMYTLELLEEAGFTDCKSSSIPMDPSVKLVQDSAEPILDEISLYRKLVGKMMYLTITRRDITFDVNKLCEFASTPKLSHLNAAYRVFRYLKDTVGLDLFYSVDLNLLLSGFTDADWLLCPDTRPVAIVCFLVPPPHLLEVQETTSSFKFIS
ncbi:unnamed protein product [Microthlaspi erraticum]|uniref:Reverse transcriptase Ty1/copia-type domain-containing protein n=1 Tax=Microthlaspi erraticum TaxID=1685480 RepID=A0A6D2HN72_9BRAS|nr:unnamed protein product [Microthlaspi erraticum]